MDSCQEVCKGSNRLEIFQVEESLIDAQPREFRHVNSLLDVACPKTMNRLRIKAKKILRGSNLER
jgi:hypothetical protein